MLTDVGGLALALLAIRLRGARGSAAEDLRLPSDGSAVRVDQCGRAATADRLHPVRGQSAFRVSARSPERPDAYRGGHRPCGQPRQHAPVGRRSSESLNVKGAYFEVLSDMLGSIGVIAAALLMMWKGWRLADPIIGAGIGLFIVPRTWGLLIPSR